jgi:hypothetical protein
MARRLALVVALALGPLVAAACSSGGDAGTATTTTTPAATSTPPTTDAGPPADPADQPGHFRVYWTRDCAPPETATDITACRVAVGAARQAPEGTTDYPRTALEALLAGPDEAERSAGLGTNLRDVVVLNRYELTPDGVAHVDFNRYFETAKTRPQVAQVVYLLTQFGEVKAVEITVDGTPNGAVGVGPLTRDDVGELTPEVLVESPTLGAPVSGAFRLAGTARAPDGRVHYLVRDLAGGTRSEGAVPILAAPGGRGRFGGTVTVTGAAGPLAVLAAPTAPGPAGSPAPGEVTVPVTFTP